MNSNQAYDLQTLLSAVLTNHQTCLDGFHEVNPYPKISTTLSNPLSDGTKLYRISLSFFAQYRVNTIVGRLTEKAIIMNNRKLLQTSVDNVIVKQKVIVNPDGSGDFVTINEAVDAAPNKTGTNNGYHVIYVVAGIYNEYVSIAKSKENLMIVGDGIGRTVITGNRSVVDGWTTFQSATFAVTGKGFVAVNITFQNTAGSSKHQAVAVRNGADMSVFYNCSFEAQGRTDPNQNTGFSIWNCYIVAASDLGGANYNYNGIKTYLGRPWKEYSRTIYMQCFIDGLIDSKGWIEWLGDFALNTLYYAEFANWGQGSNTSNRVTWKGYHQIDGKNADEFTVYKFIQGDMWLPKTGVPFRAGL
ncbi:pectinesterase [Trifolium repens]|nr:pectinesterase [Trifolium repens]